MDKIDQSFCLLCGKCLEVCPVFNVTNKEELSPRSKAFLYSQMEKMDLNIKNLTSLVGNCVGCSRCYDVCTQKIDIPLEVSNLRSNSISLKRWLFLKIVKHIPELYPFIKKGFKIKNIIPHLKNIQLTRDLFDNLNKHSFIKVRPGEKKDTPDKAVVFGGCVGTYLKDKWFENALNIAKMCYEVEEDVEWECCGYPMSFAGDIKGAKDSFMRNFKIWKDIGTPKILVFCATCWLSLRKGAFFIEDEKLRHKWLNSIIYMTELIGNLKVTKMTTNPFHLALHKPCHMDEHGYDNLLDLLNNLGMTFDIIDDCCGFGGCTRLENPSLCDMLGEKLWKKVGDGSLVISGCSGCILQLCLTGDSLKVYHWLELFEF